MSDFQQTITSLNLLHTSLYRMELFMNAQAVMNAKTDVISLISRLEKAERERDELRAEQAAHDDQIARMESKFSLAKRALDSKIERCDKAEAELRRRDAAAGECAGVVTGYAVNGCVVSGNKLGIGDHVYAAAQLAVLPPKLSMDIDPELQGEFRVQEAIRRKGFNQALDAALELGAQQQEVVELPTPYDIGKGDRRYYDITGWHFDREELIAALDAANVKWEVKP